MKQALEYTRPGAIVPVTPETVKILVDALRLAIEQAERQEPVVDIELSRRMAAVKVSNFYGSIIKDAEKEIERLHGIYAAAIRARGQS
jgi:chemotaxis protein histidine kinase CheA